MQPSPRLTSIRLSGSPSGVTRPTRVADVERRVRPGRLGQVLDRHRDPAVALDEQHVPGLQHPAQRRDVGVGEGLRPRRRLVELAGEAAARSGPPRCRAPPSSPPALRHRGAAATDAGARSILHPNRPRRHLPRRSVAFDARHGIRSMNAPLPARQNGVTNRAQRGEWRPNGPAPTRDAARRRCCGRRTAATSAPTRSSCAPSRRGARDRPGARRRARADVIEDIVQETLLAIHQKRHTWREDMAVRPWLYAIVRYKVVDAFRARGRRVQVPIEDFAEVLPAAAGPRPDRAQRRRAGHRPPRPRARRASSARSASRARASPRPRPTST